MISLSSLISKDCADIHQSIMDLGYNEWQKNNSWTYSDMLEWVEETYGKEARFAIQIGKYNQQVCNGGHIQYYDNGYASEGAGGCFSTKDNIALHERLVKDFKDFGFHTTEIGSKVFEIMSAFEPEIDDERTVEGDSFDDDPVENEDFGTVVNGAEINKLDEKYFALDEAFMNFLEEQFKEFVFNGSFKIAATVADVLQVQKPKCKLVGEDGNVFAIIGRVKSSLEHVGMRDKAKEFCDKALSSKSYEEVLCLCSDYVEVR